jgi:hypothetical protein
METGVENLRFMQLLLEILLQEENQFSSGAVAAAATEEEFCTCEQLEQQNAKAINIRFGCGFLGFGKLRSMVARRPSSGNDIGDCSRCHEA